MTPIDGTFTNYESTFHTDASFEDDVVDYVGLLCVQTAKSGGLSQLVSGYSAAAELALADPSAIEVLMRPFHVDRRGGVRPANPRRRNGLFSRAMATSCFSAISAPGSKPGTTRWVFP